MVATGEHRLSGRSRAVQGRMGRSARLAVVLGAFAILLVGTGTAEAHLLPTTRAHCFANQYPMKPKVYVPAPANVPRLATGSAATQTIWFQVEFYSLPSWTKIHVSNWFYTKLDPGQVSTSYWYRFGDNALNAWSPWIYVERGAPYVAKYTLTWYQHDRQIHQDRLWPVHTYDYRDGQDGNACYWVI